MNLLSGDLLSFVSIGEGPYNKGFLLKKIYINLLGHVCNIGEASVRKGLTVLINLLSWGSWIINDSLCGP